MSERRLIDEAELSGAARELLMAGRAVEPPASSRRHLLEALAFPVAAGLVELGASRPEAIAAKAGAGALPLSGAAPWVGLGVLGVVAAGALYVLGGSGRPVARSPEPAEPALVTPSVAPAASAPSSERAPVAEAIDVPAGASEGSSVSPLVETSPPPTRATESDGSPEAVPQRTSARPPAARPLRQPSRGSEASGNAPFSAPDHQLSEEVRRLEAVRRSLRGGDPGTARQLLEGYFRRFPRGYLTPEAKRLEAQACGGAECPR